MFKRQLLVFFIYKSVKKHVINKIVLPDPVFPRENIRAPKVVFSPLVLQYLQRSSFFNAVIKKGRGIRPCEALATLRLEKVLRSTLIK